MSGYSRNGGKHGWRLDGNLEGGGKGWGKGGSLRKNRSGPVDILEDFIRTSIFRDDVKTNVL